MGGTERVAIVTGGMAGIGLATVQALLSAGMKVAVGARRAGDAGMESAFRDAVRVDVFLAVLDVRSTESIASFTSAVETTLGPVDVLVNSAGVSAHQMVCGHNEDDWLSVIDINLSGPFRMTRACLPGMIARKWGRIVNVASTAARTAMPDSAAYSASKSGLLGLTRAVALEGAPHGVSCVAVSPTWVETDMLRASAAEAAAASGRTVAEEIDEFRNSIPQNRLVQPDEVGALIAFLCGENAGGITMEDIQINAGALW
ncbi:MAG: SDR family NAD(P)-dependent oxidoreductase [Hyphomicrobiaceae bacterium]